MPGSKRLWTLAAAAVIVLLALGLGVSLSGEGQAYLAPRGVTMAPSPLSPPPTEEELGQVLPPRTEGHPKLEWVLTELVNNYALGGMAQATEFSRSRSISLTDGRVRLVATVPAGGQQEAAAAISALGGLVEAMWGNEIQFSAPLPALPAIADLPSVSYVTQPIYAVAQAVTSEGVNVVGANVWRAAGFKGKGVKVGVADLGFAGYTSLLGSELPASVTARSFRPDGDISGGGEVHGTAVAEIIYDLAPEADLYFANFRTTLELGNAVDWLIAQGVNIISASFGSSCSAPGDGTGTANDIVAKARQAGVLWVNAAGNEGEKHWSGFFTDTDGDGWHNYTPTDEGNTIQLTAGEELTICLMWDDWTQRTQDFDLVLVSSRTGTIVARSENTQAGSLPPVERIYYTPPADGQYYISIYKYKATRNVDFDLFVEPYKLVEHQVAARSVLGSIPADSPNALTVGATYWKDDQLMAYSSQGPTKDGRTKPDLAAPTGVSTRSYIAEGVNEFHGTSSSTPHVSGVAALVKSLVPSYGPAELQAYLEAQALDLWRPGKDNLYGSGRLRVPASWSSLFPDLYVESGGIWADRMIIKEGDKVGLGGSIHNGGTVPAGRSGTAIKVDFYDGAPSAGGKLIGSGSVATIAASGLSVARMSGSWDTTGQSGGHTIYVVLDPANEIKEYNEANNISSRQISVLPRPTDTVAPQGTITINGGAVRTASPQVTLTLEASDTGGSGVQHMFIRELMLDPVSREWASAQESGWKPYSRSYPWTLTEGGGARYLSLWLADGAGNIPNSPARAMIEYAPTVSSVAAGASAIYRQSLKPGDVVTLTLNVVSGDADLLVWHPGNVGPPDYASVNPDRCRDLRTTSDVVRFTAPVSGTYQIEVYGYQGSRYSLDTAITPTPGWTPPGLGEGGPRWGGPCDKRLPSAPLNLAEPAREESVAPVAYWVYVPVAVLGWTAGW